MSLAPYRRALSRRGVLALLFLVMLARIPMTAAPVVLTLHVVLDLHRGFAAAGLLAALFAVGAAVGAPLLGRAIDRVGLRPVLALTTLVEGVFWIASPRMSFAALTATATIAGLLAIPIYSLSRQALSVMLPPGDRQAGFSLDSMGVELSYAAGPPAGIALLTAAGADATLISIAVLILASGVALFAVDPPTRGAEGPALAGVPSVRSGGLMSRALVGLLVTTFGATFVVVGTDTALTGVMTDWHDVDRLGVVFVVWCFASLLGGFVSGGSTRRPPAVLVLAALAALCAPIALAPGWVALTLLIIPTGLFCAPVMSVTAESITRLAPPSVRGLVLGLHSSALTLGMAAGAPVTGYVIDHVSARASFVALGLGGLLLAAVAVGVGGRTRASVPAPGVDAPQPELLRSTS